MRFAIRLHSGIAPFLALLVGSIVAGPSALERTAHATPPIVHPREHPYDRDWLEVHWMLRMKCLGCHRPGTERHDFSTHQTLTATGPDSAIPIVVPGDPDESLLWQYVTWNHASQPDSDEPDEPYMPPEQKHEWLTEGQLETLARWIQNGALEYVLPDQCNIRPLLETDFVSARECAQCHPKQYDEWSRSMHAYAQHSPVFEAFTLTLVERTGGTIGTFCTRCHTPIGVSLGETASLRNVHRSRIAMEGVTCIVCHRLQRPFYKASSRIPVVPGQVLEACIYGPFGNPVDPDGSTHPAGGRGHILKSQLCGSCHDVTSPEGVRLEEAFSEWQNSPAAKEGVSCQECHMGPNPGVPVKRMHRQLGKAATIPGVDPEILPDRHLSDHSFVGPDYSLLPDTEFPYKLDWMYETDYRNTPALTPHQSQTLTELRVRNRIQLEYARRLRHQLLRNAAYLTVRHPGLCSIREPRPDSSRRHQHDRRT